MLIALTGLGKFRSRFYTIWAVNGLQGIRDSVPDDYLTDMQRRHEGRGHLSIPGIEVQGLAGRDRIPCRVERGLVSADPRKG